MMLNFPYFNFSFFSTFTQNNAPSWIHLCACNLNSLGPYRKTNNPQHLFYSQEEYLVQPAGNQGDVVTYRTATWSNLLVTREM